MTEITNLSRRPTETILQAVVVSMIKTMLSDTEIAELNVRGIERFGEAFAAMLAEPATYMHPPERFLELFAQSHVGRAGTIEDALRLGVDHLGWTVDFKSTGVAKEGTPVSDLLSWDGDALREELEKQFMFLTGVTAWFVFDRNVLDIE